MPLIFFANSAIIGKRGDAMEIIFEILLELILEGFKAKPQERPQVIESKETFTIHPSRKRKRIFLSLFACLTLLFLALSTIVNSDTAILFYIFGGLCFIIFVLDLFLFSYHYNVTTQKVEQTRLFTTKKTVFWQNVICVRIIYQEDDFLIALYQKDKRLAFTVSTKLENAWYLVKMAEDKGIEIREERRLSLKQIKHL